MRKLLLAAAAIAAALLAAPAAEAQYVQGKWAICDPLHSERCLTLSPSTAPIDISTATTTLLVSGTVGKSTLVTAWDVVAGGTGNFTLEVGATTTTPCDTGTTKKTGPYPLAAQAGLAKGNGEGVVIAVPAGDDLCAVTSAAVQYSGSVTYTQN